MKPVTKIQEIAEPQEQNREKSLFISCQTCARPYRQIWSNAIDYKRYCSRRCETNEADMKAHPARWGIK